MQVLTENRIGIEVVEVEGKVGGIVATRQNGAVQTELSALELGAARGGWIRPQCPASRVRSPARS